MTIPEISKKIHIISTSKGFKSPDWENFPEKIALIHSELSEALEAHRKDLMDDKLTHRHGIEVELADACIRIFHVAFSMGYDLESAIQEKVDFNATREEMHGGKKY